MPLELATGDPLTTDAEWLAIGHNARGRIELGDFETRIANLYPAAVAMFQRRARAGKHPAGTFWQWHESQPRLLFLSARDSSVSPVRLRHIQQLFLTLARDYTLYNINSLAIAPLGTPQEQPDIVSIAQMWLAPGALPVTLYHG